MSTQNFIPVFESDSEDETEKNTQISGLYITLTLTGGLCEK